MVFYPKRDTILTLSAVCSTTSVSDFMPLFDIVLLKFLLIFVIQCSAVSSLLRKSPCNTLRTLGRCTN